MSKSTRITLAVAALLISGGLVFLRLAHIWPSPSDTEFTRKTEPSQPPSDNPYQKGNVPKGRQVYEITTAGEVRPRLVRAVIDPVEAHPGQTQTLAVLVEDEAEIKEVYVMMETDNGYTKVPLKRSDKQELETDAGAQKVQAAIEAGLLAVLPASEPRPIADNERGLTPRARAQTTGVSRAVYEGSWVVRDTHSKEYRAEFNAVNAEGETNKVTVTWLDPCTPPLQGSWTLDGNCSFNVSDGIAPDNSGNGDLVINNGAYTLTLNAPFVFYEGKKVTLSAGSIAIGSNGSIVQSKLWVLDADGDGWGVTKAIQTNQPSTSYYDQSQWKTTTSTVSGALPTTGTSGSGGATAWSSPGNVKSNDNNPTSVTLSPGGSSQYLQATNFGFASIPSVANIVGIQVNVERLATVLNAVTDNPTYGTRLIKAGAFVGNVKTSATAWQQVYNVVSYGGSGDLWGTTWTPAEVKASNFGVGFSISASKSVIGRVDYISMNVSYLGPRIAAMGDCNDSDPAFTNNCTGSPVCQPGSQQVPLDFPAQLTVSGGNGSYVWTATGTPSSGSGTNFSTSYSAEGRKLVSVFSNGATTTCEVTVGASSVLCEPTSQTVETFANAYLQATGGDGTNYSWSAPGGNPSSGSSYTFNTYYTTTGSKTVTVTSGGQQAQCTVTVDDTIFTYACYPDADSDGHYSTSFETHEGGCPVGYSSSAGDDCDDGDELAYPGSDAFVSGPRSNGSFDYNCDGVETKYRPQSPACPTFSDSASCIGTVSRAVSDVACGVYGNDGFVCNWQGAPSCEEVLSGVTFQQLCN